MVRWTDNLYEIENWIKKNNAAMTNEEIYQAFPILRDLDYLEWFVYIHEVYYEVIIYT